MVVRREKIGNYMVGSDVEFFLQDILSNEIVSAEGIIKGTKTEPFKFDKDNAFYATSLDNVMAEGNIPPASSAYEFFCNVEKLRKYIDSTIPQNLRTVAIPSARLDLKHLQTENAQIFGCDPSINCWTREEVRPEPSGDNVRSAGFHIHVGYEEPSLETNEELARAMDLFLGVPSILIEPQNERKAVGYGLSGNYRHQKHGMEYRSLSSYFSSEQRLIEWCFRNTQKAIQFVNDGGVDQLTHLGDVIQNVINKENKSMATALCKDFAIEML